ncbi:conjugal transfer protein MobB [Dysgonomonas macrotermitis]|uniref:Relaxase/Mobilisation nuclease domain-containing protein n=1 Tax=Dysgonomonas macrotermitis TaxID=1346286 RepID=A0A1M5JAL1_9BACT|nr:conjugal transfer protein MobB [Dysgonomonas macrotermitis]SHG37290.1 Relaxase/Mobilisation nuclease domain-containing protein [Dysgonomonas macrotermitis]
MVAKISSGKSLFGALSYNQTKVDKGQADVLFSQNIIRTIDGSYNIPLCMRSFAPYLAANNKTINPTIHISLNPHPDDVLTDEQLSCIAQEYMDKLGYGRQPYLVYKHDDIDRKHIHIVSIRIDENGKKINDSFEKKRSDTIRKELEKKYNLLPAEQQKNSNNLPLKPVDIKVGNVKRQVGNIAKSLMKDYRFQSINEYRALLNIYGVTVEEVKGEVRDKAYNGLVYSALDKKGEKTGNPFKASLIGRDVGYDILQNRIAFSKKSMRENPVYNRTKAIVSNALHSKPKRKNFEKELAKNGISVLFRENKDKRIYGVTFIDHQEKAVFNGSKMGKEFSANTFQNLFNGQSDDKTTNNQVFDNDKDYTTSQESAVEAMAGLFSMEQHGDNYEEIVFSNRMKRKKKKPRRPKL